MRLHHVGIAVRSIDQALTFYQQALGLVVLHREEVADQKVRVVFLCDVNDTTGPQIELLEPASSDGPVARFLKSRGPGMHHLAFETVAVATDMARLSYAGWPPLENAPRPGAHGHKICFLHPKHANGVLVELVG